MTIIVFVAAILVLLLAKAFNALEGECPVSCKCHMNDIFCVGDGEASIPEDVPWTVTSLYFRNYALKNNTLFVEHINGTNITEMLTLENIGIEGIEDGAFASLMKLWLLDLEGNHLRSLKGRVFLGLTQLKKLYLRRNELTNLDHSFILLESLDFLDLSINRITKLTEDMFVGLKGYLQLIVSSNNITSLGGEGLIVNTFLSKLDLSNNPLNGSIIEIFAYKSFYLDLSRMGFQAIPRISASLTGLSLANNMIRKILNSDRWNFMGDYRRFRILNFDNNAISFIQHESLVVFESLTFLHLTNNRLTDVAFQLPLNLREMHLGGNKIKEIPAFSFTNSSGLRFLTLRDNAIETLHPCSFCGLNGVTRLDLKNNLIQSLPEGAFISMESLQALNLQNNKIERMASGCFLGLAGLKEINLSFLRGSVFFQEDVFDDLESLSVLNMQNSPYLARGFLKSPRIYRRLTKVTLLDISYNNLSTLDSFIETSFRRLRSIDLSVNTWNCNGSLLWLSKWMKSKPHVFFYLDDLNCSSPREMLQIPIMSFTEELPHSTTEVLTSRLTTHAPTSQSWLITTSERSESTVIRGYTESINWNSFTMGVESMHFNERKGMGHQRRTIFQHSTLSIGIVFGYSVLGVTIFVLLIATTLTALNFLRRKDHWFSTLRKYHGFLFKSNAKGYSVGYENVMTGDQDLLNFDN